MLVSFYSALPVFCPLSTAAQQLYSLDLNLNFYFIKVGDIYVLFYITVIHALCAGGNSCCLQLKQSINIVQGKFKWYVMSTLFFCAAFCLFWSLWLPFLPLYCFIMSSIFASKTQVIQVFYWVPLLPGRAPLLGTFQSSSIPDRLFSVSAA